MSSLTIYLLVKKIVLGNSIKAISFELLLEIYRSELNAANLVAQVLRKMMAAQMMQVSVVAINV